MPLKTIEGKMRTHRFPAIRVVQNGKVFYQTTLRLGYLLGRVDFDRFDPEENRGGYQRLSESRTWGIVEYTKQPGFILPTTPFLNVRVDEAGSRSEYGQVLQFDAYPNQDDDAVQAGVLTVDDSTFHAWGIDGQHRLTGLAQALHTRREGEQAEAQGKKLAGKRRDWDKIPNDLEDFPVMLTIADGLSRLEEKWQFRKVNSTSKNPDRALSREATYELMQAMPELVEQGEKWEGVAAAISYRMNAMDGPWQERITMSNRRKTRNSDETIKATSFQQSLRRFLSHESTEGLNSDELAVFLNRFWNVLDEMFPQAFNEPKDHNIQQAAGVAGIHNTLPAVVEELRRAGITDWLHATEDEIAEAISPWTTLGDGYWNKEVLGKGNRLGGAGANAIATDLRGLLKQSGASAAA